jgi:hypothetical protein
MGGEKVVAAYTRTATDGTQTLDSSGAGFHHFTLFFPTKEIDTHNIVTASASETVITIPESGLYEIHCSVRAGYDAATGELQMSIRKNGSTVTSAAAGTGNSISAYFSDTRSSLDRYTHQVSGIFYLTQGDTVRIEVNKYNSPNMLISGTNANFSNLRIKKLN